MLLAVYGVHRLPFGYRILSEQIRINPDGSPTRAVDTKKASLCRIYQSIPPKPRQKKDKYEEKNLSAHMDLVIFFQTFSICKVLMPNDTAT